MNKKGKKIYCFDCSKFQNQNISNSFEKLVVSIICSRCGRKDEKMFKEEESIKILEGLGLINNMEQYQKM